MRAAAPPLSPVVTLGWLHGPSRIRADELGAKAWNLCRLARAGFRVPAGACLPAQALRSHLGRHGSPPSGSASAAECVAAIRDGSLDPRTVASIEAAAVELTRDGALLAVRSSALGEDGMERSFAGLHETEIGIAADEVETAVRNCWASAFSRAALEYRRQFGLGPPGGIAVLIQRLLDAELSAVVFTIDPVQRDPERLLVELTPGLGGAMMAGEVTPTVCEFRRHPLALLRMQSPVAAGAMDAAHPASVLANLSLDVEAMFGFPVDVEAAFAAGAWWLVQARPITGA